MRTTQSVAAVAFAVVISAPSTRAQAPTASHVVIPFLANATKPSALEYEGAECEQNASGTALDCEFQQVFLTTSDVAPDTCLVTTNRYQKTFARGAGRQWISRDAPAGACGVVEVVTLTDDGGVRWTMELKKIVTRKTAASCAAVEDSTESLSWRDLRRPLPCRFVQPGGLSR